MTQLTYKILIVVSAAAKNMLDSWWLFVYVIYAYVYITCKLNTALAKQQLLLGFKMDFVSAEIWIEWRKKSDSEKSERSLTFKTFENDQTPASGREQQQAGVKEFLGCCKRWLRCRRRRIKSFVLFLNGQE